ncbi:hypothetical protein FACS1894125_0490 [Actinomycetota bacterium]|nr:hypothetical protein FACS1894125_0490 [Actinomycetota bacterium]
MSSNEFPLNDPQFEDRVNRAMSRKKQKKVSRVLITLFVVVVLLGFGGLFVYHKVFDAPDYDTNTNTTYLKALNAKDTTTLSGTETAVVEIEPGATVSDVAQLLLDNDVIKSKKAFLNVAKLNPSQTIPSNKFKLPTQISAQDAFDDLTNGNKFVAQVTVTIPEGTTVAQILQSLSDATGIKLDTLKAELSKMDSQLPSTVTSFEGWLFPDTYEFDIASKPADILQKLLDRTKSVLKTANVAQDKWEDTLIRASIVQEEANPKDFAKVARVIQNRLDDGMKLEMDTIIDYGITKGESSSGLELAQSDLDDDSNPYNVRFHEGLPPTPITNPGQEAIIAVLNPAVGEWYWFVTTNPTTGETGFYETEAEFDAGKAEYKSWCSANPSVCGIS